MLPDENFQKSEKISQISYFWEIYAILDIKYGWNVGLGTARTVRGALIKFLTLEKYHNGNNSNLSLNLNQNGSKRTQRRPLANKPIDSAFWRNQIKSSSFRARPSSARTGKTTFQGFLRVRSLIINF